MTVILSIWYATIIETAAMKFNVPADLLKAIIKVESNTNPGAISAGGVSYGMGQLTKATALRFCNLDKTNIMDPVLNTYCSAKVLAHHVRRYNGNYLKAVSAYNAGTYTPSNGWYVKRVMGIVGA